MSPLVPALAGALIVAGVIGIVVGLRPVPVEATAGGGAARLKAWWRRVPVASRNWLLAGIGVGLVAFLVTGWLLALVLPVLAAVGLPVLLGRPADAARIDRLDAMAEWTRNLAGVLVAGVGLEQAVMASQRAAPAAIRPEITQLVGRLRGRWQTEDALRAFADDLDDATGDLVVSALIIGSRHRGEGLSRVLTGLSDSVAEEVRSRRDIEADRDKARGSARLITLLAVGGMALLAFSDDLLAPYTTPIGQLVLAGLAAMFIAGLAWLRRMVADDPPPRFLPVREVPR